MASEWLTPNISLQLQGVDPRLTIVFADLCTINDATYLREVMTSWLEWAADHDQHAPLFNWVSVFNFHQAAGFHAFCLDHGGHAEALMLVREGHVVRCDAGHRQPLLYVNFLEVAPWNKPSAPDRQLRGLGPVLLRMACHMSVQRGFGGRLGLHSVATAEGFYRELGLQALDCPNEYHELYFELDESGAQALLKD